MTSGVIVIVTLGLALAVGLGVAAGFDVTAIMLLAALVVVGGLGVAVARRAERGGVTPARCDECGGIVSPNAPYCKHCGHPFSAG